MTANVKGIRPATPLYDASPLFLRGMYIGLVDPYDKKVRQCILLDLPVCLRKSLVSLIDVPPNRGLSSPFLTHWMGQRHYRQTRYNLCVVITASGTDATATNATHAQWQRTTSPSVNTNAKQPAASGRQTNTLKTPPVRTDS